MPKFIVWRLWSIYFDHHLPLKPSIGKRRKQSCTPNILEKSFSKFGTYYQFREIRASPSSRLASATDWRLYKRGENRIRGFIRQSFAIKSFLIETLVEYLSIFTIYTKKRRKYSVLISFKHPLSYPSGWPRL